MIKHKINSPLNKTVNSPLKDPRMEPEVSKACGKRILIIVESPKKIKKIQANLPKEDTYRILPSVGHVVELAKCGAFNLGISLKNAYSPKFIICDDKIDILRAIINSAKECDKILLATDPDREGEFIGFSIMEKLLSLDIPIKRIEIKEITQKGILNALQNEKDLDMGLVDASISRRVLDRVVGFLVSPLLINRFGDGLSAGRVQSVALRILVDRELEIESFVPENYWNVNVDLYKFGFDIKIPAKLVGEKIKTEQRANEIVQEIKSSNFIVKNVESKQLKKPPPIPITTSRLQMLASSRFNFGAQRTMKAAQRLYENGMITYIRTDSVRQSEEAINEIREWLYNNNSSCLPKDPNIYKNKGVIQDAHEAIRPTCIAEEPVKLATSDEGKIYKLIWETTIASQMKPALYESTTLSINCNKNSLKAYGKVLKDLGWLSITKYSELEKENEKDVFLPPVIVKDVLNCDKIVTEKKSTQPPSRYTEGSLIKELEKKEIGRPSTYADITNKIISRKFVTKKGNSFIATIVGKNLVKFLSEHFEFMNYDYTKSLEKKLDKIAKGNLTYVEMMQDFYPAFKQNIEKVYFDTEDPRFRKTCDKCGGMMYLKNSTFGFFLGCSNYPDCSNSQGCDIIDGEIVLAKDLPLAPKDIYCPKCKGRMVIRDGMFGKIYICARQVETNPYCKGWRKIPYGKDCPDCGGNLYRTVFYKPPNRGPVLCCDNYPKCRYIERLEENDFEEKHKIKMDIIKNMRRNINSKQKDFFFEEVDD